MALIVIDSKNANRCQACRQHTPSGVSEIGQTWTHLMTTPCRNLVLRQHDHTYAQSNYFLHCQLFLFQHMDFDFDASLSTLCTAHISRIPTSYRLRFNYASFAS